MTVQQVYALTNTAVQEVLGESAIVKEDLSNLVDIGASVLSSSTLKDKYANAITNVIGKRVFVDRVYNGSFPKVLMDAWQFGSILSKIQMDLPEADENETWELQNGTSYDPNIFYKPTISEKFFTKMVTFEVPMSITDVQLKQSFRSADEQARFVSMIYNYVDKAMTIRTDALVMRTINNFIGETIYADYGSATLSSMSGVKAVNLYYLYKQIHTTSTLTKDDCIYDKDFLKFATYTIGLYKTRFAKLSTLFNIEGKERFTPDDALQIALLGEFKNAVDSYLSSDTFHNELVALPNCEVVPFWQGSGTSYDYDDTSKVYVKTAGGQDVTATHVLGVMFDLEALGVHIADKRVTTNYNGKAEFNNIWNKWDARYFNDKQENFVVFLVA